MISVKDLRVKYAGLFPLLDERQRRVVTAADAISLGPGRVESGEGLGAFSDHRP